MKRILLPLFVALSLPVWMSAADNQTTDSDNTGRNERDRDHKTLTPGDQSESETDIKLTQTIRQAIIKDNSLSVTAKNIKIITINGKVTLRGPVISKEEKAKINDLAETAAGHTKVDNQLEVIKGEQP